MDDELSNPIKWDRPCYKCGSHYCDLSCSEPTKNVNAASQEKGIRDILRDTVRSIIAAHSDGDLDVPLAIADLRAALANKPAPQDQHQKNLKVRAYLHPTSDDCVTTDPTAYINPRLLVALSDIRTAAVEQVSRDCQWQASLEDKRDAERYRMARFKGTISDEWQESLDHWIALNAALAAMKEKP